MALGRIAWGIVRVSIVFDPRVKMDINLMNGRVEDRQVSLFIIARSSR